MSIIFYYFDLLGTAVFAISGVLLAAQKRMDFIGVLTLATAVAIGGGTTRDLLLGVETIFWIANNTYLYVIFASAILGILFLEIFHRLNKRYWIPIFDAVGLAVFLGIGVSKSLDYGTSSLVAVLMGTLTGVGGGIIRDLLAREIPMVLRKEIYATACLSGGSVMVIALYLEAPHLFALLLGMGITLMIRLIAIVYKLRLPELKL